MFSEKEVVIVHLSIPGIFQYFYIYNIKNFQVSGTVAALFVNLSFYLLAMN